MQRNRFTKGIVVWLATLFIFGSVVSSVSAATFTDVKTTNTHYKAIQALADQKVIKGYGDGTFGVWDSITRQQAAQIISRSLNLSVPKDNNAILSQYKDLSKNNKARPDIGAVVEAGIMKGSNGKFRPYEKLTREQLATILVQGYKLNKVPQEKVLINLKGTSNVHRPNVQILANLYITVATSNYQSGKEVSRGAFATMLYRSQQVKSGISLKPVTNKPDQTKPISQAEIVKKEQRVIELTNKERTKRGLKPVKLDNALAKVAKEKSRDMSKKDYFDHNSPTYGSPFKMMDHFGIKYTEAGENIAIGYETADDVVNGWMNSKGHRENILNGAFTYIGVGYEPNGHLWTQHFIKK